MRTWTRNSGKDSRPSEAVAPSTWTATSSRPSREVKLLGCRYVPWLVLLTQRWNGKPCRRSLGLTATHGSQSLLGLSSDTLAKSLKLSKPQFPYLYNGDENNSMLEGGFKD